MFEFIKKWYDILFADADLISFVNANMLTQAQVDEIKGNYVKM